MTDKKVWQMARVSDGKWVSKKETDILDVQDAKAKAKDFKPDVVPLPAGAKCYAYRDLEDEYDNNYVSKWKHIFRMSGISSGQS